jgi:dihydrofolate reductase
MKRRRVEMMRKVIMFNLISLDGFFEGPEKWDLSWHQVDGEFNEFAFQQLNQSDGLIFGRVTYQGMASYWQSPAATKDDPEIALKMNSIQKYVFSKTLDKAEWNNTRLINGDAASELEKIKQQPGRDLLLFGSATLSETFIKNNLIDEYRLMVNPLVLGRGGALFKANHGMLRLKLLNTRTFHNGNLLLYYEPDER